MPCSDGYPQPSEVRTTLEEQDTVRTTYQLKKIKELQDQNRALMKLLCGACRVLKRLGYDFNENHQLAIWWANHQVEDETGEKLQTLRSKKTKKAIVDRVIASLTQDEIKLLTDTGFIERP